MTSKKGFSSFKNRGDRSEKAAMDALRRALRQAAEDDAGNMSEDERRRYAHSQVDNLFAAVDSEQAAAMMARKMMTLSIVAKAVVIMSENPVVNEALNENDDARSNAFTLMTDMAEGIAARVTETTADLLGGVNQEHQEELMQAAQDYEKGIVLSLDNGYTQQQIDFALSREPFTILVVDRAAAVVADLMIRSIMLGKAFSEEGEAFSSRENVASIYAEAVEQSRK